MADKMPDSEASVKELMRQIEELKLKHEKQTRLLEEEQSKTRKTTFVEFLDACHNFLQGALSVQTDKSMTTQGSPANATKKLRPERIRHWTNFPAEQRAIWDDIMRSSMVSGRHFKSLLGVQDSGQDFKERRPLSSELDLHHFQRTAIETPVSSIIHQMFKDVDVREQFKLKGSVEFENHSNTLVRDSPLVPETPEPQSTYPRPDQFCVHNTGAKSTEAAYIMEYKAPHKLTLNYIVEGLRDLEKMELEDVVFTRARESFSDTLRRLIAAVITQAFSYMIKMGSEYGCVCTGEAYIFLRVFDDPETVYYHLSVPKVDAEDSEGKIEYEEVLSTVRKEKDTSEYKPSRNGGYQRTRRFSLRKRPLSSSNCKEPEVLPEASDDEPDADTPSRTSLQPRSRGTGSRSNGRSSHNNAKGNEYCTQKCLLGLIGDGLLDQSCPNAQHHGETHHQISQSSFLHLIRQQLSRDLDNNCKPVCRPGATGVLFRVRLEPLGYTVAAKASPAWYVDRLKLESTIYEHLRSLQGIYVPVHLGNVDLPVPYMYEGICDLVHMLFMGYGGETISKAFTDEDIPFLNKHIDRAAGAIHKLGVLHKDLVPRNILWNEETGRVMVIDFERSEIVAQRPALAIKDTNRKSKRQHVPDAEADAGLSKIRTQTSVFENERNRAVRELYTLRRRLV
ncbi:hypothetical protein DM02DRAFT_718203 [Periconia macrospinosa]|uniref:Protein kinase domain-containing protein n=1 Tax=Periconia macrospinosa TaxID=97972 RepID=A0A2V1DRZ6_9PLEO|nr:hypothetical protein DM02DRAFT_718203 [Periconia macrospinosa]